MPETLFYDNFYDESVSRKSVSSHVCLQERVDHLESHRNRLEATLSPQLVAAFSSLDRYGTLPTYMNVYVYDFEEKQKKRNS